MDALLFLIKHMKTILKKHINEIERLNRFERRLAVVRKLREIFPDYRGVYRLTEYQFIDFKNI